jgi:hypothetical protein
MKLAVSPIPHWAQMGPDAHSLPRREERRRRDNIKRRKYARVKATIQKDNIIEINTHYVRRLTFYLNDQMVNLARPITIVTNGSVTYEGDYPADCPDPLSSRLPKNNFGTLELR